MTTLAPGQPAAPDTPDTPAQPESPHRASRAARWRASWRVALRMARRDVRRHRGRSILVFVMVSLPVALLVAAACWADTGNVSGADRIPMTMGTGQALVRSPEPSSASHSLPSRTATAATAPRRHPSRGSWPARTTPPRCSASSAASWSAVTETDARFLKGDRRVRIHGLVVDGRRADLGPKAELSSGRWPADNTEIVVTAAGVEKGMPDSGNVSVSVAGELRDVEVVGTAKALSSYGGQPDFVVPTPFEVADMYGSTWILKRDKPVLWSEVRTLNGYGIAVESAAVLRDPPDESELDPIIQRQAGLRGQPGRDDRPRRWGHALHRHHPARRPGLRRERLSPAPHPGHRGEQRRRDPAAAPVGARPGAGARGCCCRRRSSPRRAGPQGRRGHLAGHPPRNAHRQLQPCRGSRWPSSSRARSSARSPPRSSRRSGSAGSTSSASCAARASRRRPTGCCPSWER